jgi:putative membrane protein
VEAPEALELPEASGDSEDLEADRPVEGELQEVGDMNGSNEILSSVDRERISARIARLEKETDAEVVCAVASESGRYGRAGAFFGFCVGVAGFLVSNLVQREGDWAEPSLVVQLGWLLGGNILGCVAAARWPRLRDWFVLRSEMEEEVHRSVHLIFSRNGVGGTRQKGGVLIFLSLFERRLEIRCDRAAAGKISQAELDGIRDAVLEKVRTGEVAAGLLAGLDRAEEIFARIVPATAGPSDALVNDVLVFHPRP